MFIGNKKISTLRSFTDGFLHAEGAHHWVEDHPALFPLPFHFFHEYVRIKLGYSSSTCGWNNMILEGNKGDEEKSLNVFFHMHEEFLNIKMLDCESAVLTEENKQFHIYDRYAPKRVTFDEHGNELRGPCFTDPEQIYVIKLSDQLGYLKMIITKKECIQVFYFSKQKKYALESFHRYFGEDLSWTQDEWSDERLSGKELDWTSAPLDPDQFP